MCKKLDCIPVTKGNYILDISTIERRVCERLRTTKYSCRTNISIEKSFAIIVCYQQKKRRCSSIIKQF